MIRVIATARVLKGRRDEILGIFGEIISITRQEAGCRQYELHENTADPLQLCVIEEWDADADMDAHLASPHMQDAFPKIIACCEAPPSIQRYSFVDVAPAGARQASGNNRDVTRFARLLGLALLAALTALGSFRLFLKDGTHHTVREYEVQGDRVRYYSTERGDWEEIPVELVDLKRTESTRRESEERLAAEEKVQSEEEAAERALAREIRRVPPEPGVYLVAGEALQKIPQIDVEYVTDKKRAILKAITPLPFIAGKATFEVKGERSVNIAREKRPEFYVRQSNEESLAIFRMGARKGNRVVEQVQVVPVSKELIEEPDIVETFRRQFADGLYKIWPTGDLTSGEYAVVQFTLGKGNPQVWDFRVE